ncbi:uncharacterized protein [Miscanthus floridulus]|uniref:uncharacterized protein n=1 Tax=Miscanthus floridulus TaxID=154761 RepID=UPI0034583107
MDHPASLPRDSSVRAANHAEGERLRKAKEDKRKKQQRKLQARERREDTDSDGDDDDGDDDEVVDDIEWDDLENEDVLTGIGSSLQESGPFPFHGGEGTSGEPAETGRTVGLPQEPTGAGGSATAPEVPAEAGGSTVAPQDPSGASPSAQEQGAGSKRPRPDEAEQRSGASPPKRICRPTAMSVGRQHNPLTLAPKKSVALQARRQPSAGVAPVSGGSGDSVTVSPVGQALPTVVPVPSAGRADAGAQGTPSGVAEQPAIPLPTTRRTGLPTVAGATQLVGTPPTQAEVVEAVTGGPTRHAPSAAQVMASGVGRTEGDATEVSPEVVVLGEESASVPMTPSVVRGSVPTGTSWREGSAAIGAGGEPSLALTSVGSDSSARGEHLLRWASPKDLTSTLFTLDNAAESMDRESLNVGVASVLEALDHAQGALRDVVVPSGQDRHVKEARLRREVTAQLVAAQQRVAELTPLAEEADSLRSRMVEARRHADEAERAFEALSARSRKDDEEAAKVRKERDELLRKDAVTRPRILALLAEVEKERELKLGAEEKLATLEKRASLDAAAVARLRKERDELLQTAERHRSEHGAAREERDQACQERNNAQQKVGSLQAKLGSTTTQKLEAESVSVGLAVDLAEARRNLQAESDELGILSAALGVACDDLAVVRSEGISSLAARAVEITARVRQLERNALRAGVNQSLAIARSHYEDSIDLEAMSHGFAPGYEAHELDEMETAVAPLSQDLADRIESIVLPRRA